MKAHAALLTIALSASAAFAQTPLKVASPPAVLADPKVAACRLLAAPRANPQIPDGVSAVAYAAEIYTFGPVIEGLFLCREALAAYPNEHSVITAEYTASETFKNSLFGEKRVDGEAQLFRFALAHEAELTKMPTRRSMYFLYLGSGYEYGVGTPIDFAQAMKNYLVASAQGSGPGPDVAKRKIASLLQKAQASVQK